MGYLPPNILKCASAKFIWTPLITYEYDSFLLVLSNKFFFFNFSVPCLYPSTLSYTDHQAIILIKIDMYCLFSHQLQRSMMGKHLTLVLGLKSLPYI